MMMGVTVHMQDGLAADAGKATKAFRVSVVLCVVFAPLLYTAALLFTVFWVLPTGKWEEYSHQANIG